MIKPKVLESLYLIANKTLMERTKNQRLTNYEKFNISKKGFELNNCALNTVFRIQQFESLSKASTIRTFVGMKQRQEHAGISKLLVSRLR